jgi:SAM-dependent methyltransferase
MSIEEGYRERYKSGDTPWDIGQADFNLVEVLTNTPVTACKALDIGCGTGDNSIWLAQNGFQVTGTDTSDVALTKAKGKCAQANAVCEFLRVDFMNAKIEGAPFGFIFDRGCFHSFGSVNDRRLFAQNVAAHLADGGLWLSIIGNADEARMGPGPPQRSAGDIVLAVEPYFEIISLITGTFGSNHPSPPRAWRCLMKKRKTHLNDARI